MTEAELNKIYAAFTDAYFSLSQNYRHIHLQICREQIDILKNKHKGSCSEDPDANALLSYMLLESSRIPAILRAVATKRGLKYQDRKLWDKGLIKEGLEYLEKSAHGNSVSIYHLRAGVAACHSLSKTWRATDWNQILLIYDNYLKVDRSLEIALERAEVILHYKGARAQIKALEDVLHTYDTGEKVKLYEKLGELNTHLHDYKKALECYEKAVSSTDSKKDKSIYKKKIQYCKMRLNFKNKYNLELSF